MKTQNKFAQMQTPNNFIKLLEIRKEDSFQKVLNQNMSIGLGTGNYVISSKGLLTVNMEIIDCEHQPKCELKCGCNYKLVFNGYQRIKVNELLEYIDYMNENIDIDNWFNIPSYLKDNEDWLTKYYDWIKDYLKNEEYCIIYFIDKAETFKANSKDVK